MIYCEQYKATIPGSTCIARHKIIDQKKHNNGNGKNWGNTGRNVLHYDGCINCETGLELYNNHKTGGKNDMNAETEKICQQCKEVKPKDRKHFDRANKADDRLTKKCKVCRGTEKPKPAKLDAPKEKKIQPVAVVQSNAKAGKKIVLDLTKHPELIKKLEQWADDNMRTVNNQIVFHLMYDALAKRKVA